MVDNKKTSFLKDAFDMSGWGSGRPTYEQEEEYILDYFNQYGRVPSPQELGGWSRQQDKNSWKFTPESTMGRMGFKNLTEYDWSQKHGTSFGPHTGELVPSGGLVVTSKQGAPIGRFMDIENPNALKYQYSQHYLPETDERYYRQTQTWENPTPEELFSKLSPQQVYRARYEDYLGQKLEKDTIEANKITDIIEAHKLAKDNYIASLSGLVENGVLTSKDATAQADKWLKDYEYTMLGYQNQLYNLLTKDKMKQLLSEADYAIGQGELDNLPMFKDVQNIMGSKTNELYNQLLGQEKQTFMQNQPPAYTPGTEMMQPEGSPSSQSEFLSYVDNLNLAGSFKDWLKNQYYNFMELWNESGRGLSFIDWLRQYLASGGR